MVHGELELTSQADGLADSVWVLRGRKTIKQSLLPREQMNQPRLLQICAKFVPKNWLRIVDLKYPLDEDRNKSPNRDPDSETNT